MTPEEERLRACFQELRTHDQRNAPEFRKMWAAPRPARSPWRAVVPLASIAAAAMFLLWCGAETLVFEAAPQRASAPAAAPADLAPQAVFDPAPLDFLLDVPGSTSRSAQTSFDTNPSSPIHGW